MLIRASLAAAMSLALIVPAFAQDASTECYTQAQLDIDTKAAAGLAKDPDIRIVGGAEYDGATSDAVVIVRGGDQVFAFMFKDGCMVGMAPVDSVKPKVGA